MAKACLAPCVGDILCRCSGLGKRDRDEFGEGEDGLSRVATERMCLVLFGVFYPVVTGQTDGEHMAANEGAAR